MKKLMLLLFLGLVVVALAACGDGGKPDAMQTEPAAAPPMTAGSSAVDKPDRLEHASGTFTITQGGMIIEPYECLLSADTYYRDGVWKGVEASLLPPWEIAEKLPVVRFDETLRFQMSDNAELRVGEVFDHGYEREYNIDTEDEFRALIGELNSGTYYVVMKVGYTGKYIQEEDKYNTSIYLYMFRMAVGDTVSEDELRWEDAPPLYHIAIVRADGWKEDSELYSPEVTVISSYDEMSAFRPVADYSYRNFDAFRELIKQYGPTAFEGGNTLLAIHVKDSTGSASYSVDSVDIGDEIIDIRLKRVCPEAFTDDEAQWIVFIELEKGVYQGQTIGVGLSGI